ncbi:nucleoside 2-deoxyribosyltransferase [Geodermatophilus sp. SYSU D00815]
MRVYLAGPLFTPVERRYLDELAAVLRADGFDVFVPHEQEFLVPAEEMAAAVVHETDRRGIDAADAVVAVLDGPMVDDGTAAEVGLFAGLTAGDPRRRGIVGVLTDSRAVARDGRPMEGRGLNLFLRGLVESVGCVVTSADDVLPVLRRWRDG